MKRKHIEVKKNDNWFKELHNSNNPLILYNIWDSWSALTVQKTGAKVLATSSWAVAASKGYLDGENLSFKLAIDNLNDIIHKVGIPVTFDFEAGFAIDLETLKNNTSQVIKAGAIGINFEDQIIGEKNLRYSIQDQCERITAIKGIIAKSSLPSFFINARTDIFLQKESKAHDKEDLIEAISRSEAYYKAGADGFFAPGLENPEFIKQLCEDSPIPVNIMVQDVESLKSLTNLGVSRFSFGPFPYMKLTHQFECNINEATIIGEGVENIDE